MEGIKFNTGLIGKLSGRINYLSARNDVLAQNIAHLETPEYKAKDLEFKGFVEDFQNAEKGVFKPDTNEILSAGDPGPNGNNVRLEDQMAQVADNSVEFMVATEVIKKNLALIKFSASDQ